jgi:hypothetical protein
VLNHARTLLINVDGSASPGNSFFGEEFVPATFKPLELPTYLTLIRDRLFGSRPDRAMFNYRAWQFMRLLHTAALEQFVLDLDPRVTYVNSLRTDLFVPETYVPVVNQISGDPAELYIQAGPAAPDVVGQVRHRYNVDIRSATTVSVKQQSKPQGQVISDFVLTDGISERIDLGDSGYGVLLSTHLPSAEWTVEVFNRPTFDLGQIVVFLESVGDPVLTQLFGAAPAEPYRTFMNLWNDSNEVPWRLGGFLLAVIYRMDELRRVNG